MHYRMAEMTAFFVLAVFGCEGVFALLPFFSMPFPRIASHDSMTTSHIQVCTRNKEITIGLYLRIELRRIQRETKGIYLAIPRANIKHSVGHGRGRVDGKTCHVG